MGLGFGIRKNPGVKKAPNPGYLIRIRNTAGKVDPSRLAQIFIRKLLCLFNFDDGVGGIFYY
jgi:hypothetical protein